MRILTDHLLKYNITGQHCGSGKCAQLKIEPRGLFQHAFKGHSTIEAYKSPGEHAILVTCIYLLFMTYCLLYNGNTL